jgi:hypothetical protein
VRENQNKCPHDKVLLNQKLPPTSGNDQYENRLHNSNFCLDEKYVSVENVGDLEEVMTKIFAQLHL